ncbi:MAG: XrtA system polysaccharide chain length determinant [Rhizomicrobium sp.]
MGDSSSFENLKTLLLEHAIMLWRRKWLALGICWTICLVGWFAITLMPKKYESSARAYVNVNGLLTPLLKGMVVDTVGGQGEEYLRQTLLSRPNLEQVLVLAGLDNGLSRRAKEQLVDDMARRTEVKNTGKNLVSISYEGSDPVAVKNVVQALLTIFAERATNSSRVEMEKAQKFLDNQIANYETQLRSAEMRRAEFRKQYEDILPDTTTGIPRQQYLEQQLAQTRQQYAQAVITRDSLAAQVRAAPALLSVQATPVVGPDGKLVAATPATRLAEARRTVAELRLHYTDNYPDLKAALHDEDELQKIVASGRGNEGTTQISNPVYEQLRLKLVDAETAVPTLKAHLDDLNQDYEKTKALSSQIPYVEAKSKNLDRDYDVIKANYDELVKRRESASLSQAADDQADRTQFRVVDPPEIPLNPSFPNLPIMYSVILVLGLGGGIGVPLALAYLQPTFVSATSLRGLGLPVIGSVTRIHNNVSGGGLAATPLGPAFILSGLIGLYAIMIFISTGAYRWLR